MRRGLKTDDHTAINGARVSVRFASDADLDAIEWVAQRDTRRTPARPLLVAEIDGRILAARSLADGAVVADPFSRTGHLTEMLELRAAQLGGQARRAAGRRTSFPSAAVPAGLRSGLIPTARA